MKLTSPGILSDMIFHRFAGEIIDRGDFVKTYTESNPSYYYGNFLIFPSPPKAGDRTGWIDLFDAEFAYDAGVNHHTFQWLPDQTADPAVLKEFTDIGFIYDHVSVLTATQTQTDRKPPTDIICRTLQSDQDWNAVIDAQIASGNPSIPPADYRLFKEAQFANYRAMTDAGLGSWFGAFLGEELAADMGLYFDDHIGRFQSVETAEAYRRRGICTALVQYVSQWGFAHRPGATLMIHADHDDVPSRLYQSLGYSEVEVIESLFRPPA